ncbi:MAG: serine--tRNA ligase [Nanoarchaeota archaeon]|nr:serine--tRNA ligase [Nanoarchaeota archaeon]
MLDIKLIRENPDFVRENLKKRIGFNLKIIDEVLDIDENWRKQKKVVEALKADKNKESKKISELKKSGRDIKSQIAKVKKVSDKISLEEEKLNNIDEERKVKLISIPNMLEDSVPIGKDDEENVEVRTHLKKRDFKFKARNHQELCEMNDWYDMEKAAQNSGARFYNLKNEMVLLEVALYNYVLSKLALKGYSPVEVPPMLRREVIGKSVSLEDFEEVIYKIDGEDLYLIATSEPALAALHIDEIIAVKDLPKRYAGLSNCFRKEAGVTKDSKGIFRVHNFNKIEQFIFSKPEDSQAFLDEILENAEEIFRDLGIHYRIVDICTGDIGSFAAKKYDLEAWLPGQEKYREMVSASNYGDYGARRLNCRYQDEKNELKFVHTLNSTAIALTRTLIAIIETHQTEDGNVKIPEVLRTYFGGREYLLNK